MELHTEILIIGGGPAGSAAAIAAHKKNIPAIIIDRNNFPRDKVCGDGLLLSVLDLLEEHGIKKETFLREDQYAFPKHITCYNSKKEKLVLDNPFVTIKRMELDNLLWKAIPDAVQKYGHAKIESIIRVDEKYVTELNIGNERYTITCHYIIGADGYSSYVKRNFFKDLKFPHRVASRSYIKDMNYEHADSFNFYFDDELAPGYFWAFKISENNYNTGVYLDDKTELDLYKTHDRFLQKYFNVALSKEGFHTWTIPANTEFAALANDNIILTGDAAGLCDKLFGHGIDTAIVSGYLAVKSIAYHQSENQGKYEFAEIYRYNLQQHAGQMLKSSESAYNRIRENKAETLGILNSFFKNEIH